MTYNKSIIIPIVLIFTTSAALFSNKAQAELITFNFSGYVRFVDAPLTDYFHTSQLITGSYTFESTTPDSLAGNDQQSIYSDSIVSASVQLGAFSSTLIHPENTENGIFVIDGDANLFPGNEIDYYDVTFDLIPQNLISNVDRVFFRYQSNQRNLPSPAITSDQMPLTPPNLSFFEYNGWTLSFIDQDGQILAEAQGNIGTLSMSAVPLPSSTWLLGSGLFFMISIIRKKPANDTLV